MRTAEALERLAQLPAALATLPLARPVAAPVELTHLIRTTDQVVARMPKTTRRPSPNALEQARRDWEACGRRFAALGSRARRVLCGDGETAPTAAFLAGVEGSGELDQKRRWLELLAGVYFDRWTADGEMDRLARLLRAALGAYRGRSALVEACRPVAGRLFSRGAAEMLAEEAVAGQVPLPQVLGRYLVPPTSALAAAAADRAVAAWIGAFQSGRGRWSDADAVQQFRYLRFSLLPSGKAGEAGMVPASRESLGSALSAVILWDRTPLIEVLLAEVVEMVRVHPWLGDPRLPRSAPNWAAYPEARDRIIALQARQDLAFFFDFVIQDRRDPHGRKRFWLQYVDRVADSQVALSAEDAARLRAQASGSYAYAHTRRQPGDPPGVSAFLMRFRDAPDLIFVEFSLPGNALYVHNETHFRQHTPNGLRATRIDFGTGLKNPASVEAAIGKIVHRSGWEHRVRMLLSRRGIRPV
jgi:hypothetical protein